MKIQDYSLHRLFQVNGRRNEAGRRDIQGRTSHILTSLHKRTEEAGFLGLRCRQVNGGRKEKVAGLPHEGFDVTLEYLDGVAGLRGHGLNAGHGNFLIGLGRKNNGKAQLCPKMGPENAMLQQVQGPGNTYSRLAVKRLLDLVGC